MTFYWIAFGVNLWNSCAVYSEMDTLFTSCENLTMALEIKTFDYWIQWTGFEVNASYKSKLSLT